MSLTFPSDDRKDVSIKNRQKSEADFIFPEHVVDYFSRSLMYMNRSSSVHVTSRHVTSLSVGLLEWSGKMTQGGSTVGRGFKNVILG